MCEVCAIFGAGEHWSDFSRQRNERFPFEDIKHYRAERKRRIDILNGLLKSIDVEVIDWDGEALALVDARGRMNIAATISDIWKKLETIARYKIDPLDEKLLVAI